MKLFSSAAQPLPKLELSLLDFFREGNKNVNNFSQFSQQRESCFNFILSFRIFFRFQESFTNKIYNFGNFFTPLLESYILGQIQEMFLSINIFSAKNRENFNRIILILVFFKSYLILTEKKDTKQPKIDLLKIFTLYVQQ